MRTSSSILGFAIAASLLASHAAHAQPSWRFDVGATTRWFSSSSAAAMTTSSMSTATLAVERTLARAVAPRGIPIELSVGAGADFGSVDGETFQRFTTTTSTSDVVAAAHATARLHRNVAIGARASLGAARSALTITEMYTGLPGPVDDHGWGSIATASLGADVELVALPHLRLGLGLEAGYVAASAIELHAYPTDRPADEVSIDTTYASIGHLDLGGWSMRFGVHAAF